MFFDVAQSAEIKKTIKAGALIAITLKDSALLAHDISKTNKTDTVTLDMPIFRVRSLSDSGLTLATIHS